MTESELRDLLTQKIEVLESGLLLLAKEKYLPNSLGTRSFVDLYAKDEQGHHVLIELKRSDAAAREAIHEIHKYVEGVKQHLGARDEEIRIILASTEWRELLVPFSRFAADTNLAIVGLQLQVEEGSKNVTASPVSLLPISQGRFIAPWHDVNWYLSQDTLDKGVVSIETCCRAKGIEDYVIVLLQPPRPIHSEHQAAMWSVLQQTVDMKGTAGTKKAPELPTYEFMAYFAMETLTAEQYLRVLERDPEQLAEVRETTEGMDESEALQYLHESMSSLDPRPVQDHFEIGYPAKFAKFLHQYGCIVKSIRRYGMFARNEVLDDESILSELRGEDGGTGQRFKRTLNIANRAHVAAARREIASCLEQNPLWRNHVLRAMDEIEREFPTAAVEISIYNPQAGLFTIFFTATREDGALFLPSYSIIVKSPEPKRMYFGALAPLERTLGFRELLGKYYSDDLGQLLFTMSWGGREDRDLDVLEDAGAVYRSFRCDLNLEERHFFTLRDERWREVGRIDPFSLWDDFLEQNEAFVGELVHAISACYKGGYYELVNTDHLEASSPNIAMGKATRIHSSRAPIHCQLCGAALSDDSYMVEIPGQSGQVSEILCIECFSAKTSGLLLYAVDRGEIESEKAVHIKDFFKRITATNFLCRELQGRVEISVSGYDDDKMELWEIRQVRRWFKRVDNKVKYWFFFCNTKSPAHGLKTYFACLCDAKRRTVEVDSLPGAKLELDSGLLAAVFDRNWPYLNEMTEKLGMPEDENKRISFEVMDVMGIPRN